LTLFNPGHIYQHLSPANQNISR